MMDPSHFFLPTHAKHSIRTSFPSKSTSPPVVPIEKGEPADDFFDNTVYLLNVCVDKSSENMAVSTSANDVKIYSTSTATLVGQLSGHRNIITGIQYSEENPNTIVTSSEDGTVAVWDVRSNKQSSSLKYDGTPFRSVAIKDHLVCGGAGGPIAFWDLRSPGSPHVLTDYFSQDVTQLKFHPNRSNSLYAGSYDGLVCLIDSSLADPEDLVHDVLNIGTSVSRIGFFGPNLENLHVLAPTEQLQVWNLDNSSKVADFGFDLREKLSDIAQEPINYIIDCKYNSVNDQLLLFGGSFSGLVVVFLITETQICCLSKLGGHSAVVRDVHFDNQGKFAITVGEDSLLQYWEAPSNSKSTSHHASHLSHGYTSTFRNKPY